MGEHGLVPQEKVNQMLAALRVASGAENSFVAVYTFAHDLRKDIELTPAVSVPDLTGYLAAGGTALFGSVRHVLLDAMAKKRELEKTAGTEVLVLLNVLSDGEDTASTFQSEACRSLAEEYRLAGFHLNVTGLGIRGERLAEVLGFAATTAKTFEATSKGLGEALDAVTEITNVSFEWTQQGVPGKTS
jgi:hypothetical protein